MKLAGKSADARRDKSRPTILELPTLRRYGRKCDPGFWIQAKAPAPRYAPFGAPGGRLRIHGFKFFFSNEHLPIHVHVRYGGGEAVFVVEEAIQLRESHGLNVRDLGKVQSLAEENRELIIEKWNEHLG